jgi:hypothetical protein
MKPYVQLALPRRKPMRQDERLGAAIHASPQGKCGLSAFDASSSLLNYSFNICWARLHNDLAMGQPITHWAILHDDIEAPGGWVDDLMEVLVETNADFVAAHMPIKAFTGLTSMGVHYGDLWDINRFTMRRLADLPATFTSDEVDGNLILNTGCCLLRLRDPWLSHPEDFLFTDLNRMAWVDGQRKAQCVSEDWVWTDKLRKAGAKLAATRRVECGHEGSYLYRNHTVWGEWYTDRTYDRRHGLEDQVSGECELPAEQSGELVGA